MKKLSLKNATSMLSRNEMKAIIGGGYEGTSCTGGNFIYGGHLYVCYQGKYLDMGEYNPGF